MPTLERSWRRRMIDNESSLEVKRLKEQQRNWEPVAKLVAGAIAILIIGLITWLE